MQFFSNGGAIGRSNLYRRTMPEFVGSYTISYGSVTAGRIITLSSLSGGIGFRPAIGDLVVLSTVVLSDNTDFDLSASGYTEVVDMFSPSGTDVNLYVGYKYLTSTDTAVQANVGLSSITTASGYAISVWRNIDKTSPLDVTTTSTNASNSFLADPPAITTITPNAAVIGIGAGSVQLLTTGSPTDAKYLSSDLSGFVSSAGNTVNSGFDSLIGMGYLIATTPGTYNPDAFTYTTTSSGTNRSFAAVTLALRPTSPMGIYNLNAEAYPVV